MRAGLQWTNHHGRSDFRVTRPCLVGVVVTEDAGKRGREATRGLGRHHRPTVWINVVRSRLLFCSVEFFLSLGCISRHFTYEIYLPLD